MIYMLYLCEGVDFDIFFINRIGVIKVCLVCKDYLGDMMNRIIYDMLL